MLASDVLRLFTTPANVPVISGRGSIAHRRTVLRIDYATDEHGARKLLPEPLELTDIPLASIYLTQYHDMYGDEPIIEVAQAIECRAPGGAVGDFVVAVYTDSMPALLGNREMYLQPVLHGIGAIRHQQSATEFSLCIGDTEVMWGSAAYKHDPAPLPEAEAFFARPKFYLKILGSPLLGEPVRHRLFSLEPSALALTEAYRAPSRITFRGHVMAPLDDLPIVQIQGCQYVEGEWVPGGAEIIHRYN
ncbi:acetoacetate decarboxylase [Curtobacterium luteum]|uniref:Acetoacetate decarboxylase n=1 Tax=Curtobacterium luteum TaxID=33881 RepID=A0ABS2RVI5_9MICO|nr:acetoacetate decarboxylase family protein [Curtobacterium luteum]MBM7802748.1 acetoacetate decarboxylase [Curtobacterium luteum]NUU49233.1 hypothetical protein [Curtobacterium luteum]